MNESTIIGSTADSLTWKENPFSLRILPQLFVGYSSELGDLLRNAQNNEKVMLLLGPTGAGKTTLLKKFTEIVSQTHVVLYITKPPQSPEEFVHMFKSVLKPSFWERLFFLDKITLYELPDYTNKKLKGRHMVLLVDECHEASTPILEWIRTLSDQIDNVSVVLAGLPILEATLAQKLETLLNRVTNRTTLTSLSREETEELIRKRIEFAGGAGIGPFSHQAIDVIFQRTGGFPRNVLKMCDELAIEATNKHMQIIDENIVGEAKTPEIVTVNANFMDALPEKQKEILRALSESGPLNPNDIATKIGVEEYKTEDHASRSVNNILRRLMETECIVRERRGKGFVYKLSPKVRTIMATS